MIVSFVYVSDVHDALKVHRKEITVPHYETAKCMVASVQKAMPNAEIIQYSDKISPKLVDHVIRMPFEHGHLMEFRLRSLLDTSARSCNALWLALDTDVLLLRDPEPSLAQYGRFDIAMYRRSKVTLDSSAGSRDVTKQMPYNTGFIAGYGSDATRMAYYLIRDVIKEDELRVWWGDQVVLAYVARQKNIKCADLPFRFNYPPEDIGDIGPEDCVMLHYKGAKRKPWQLAVWKELNAPHHEG